MAIATHSTDGITFAVDPVTPATTRLSEETLLASLERRSGRSFVSLPEKDRLVVANASFHPLIEAIHRAFADHRPLILSPDDIWLTIQQGFAHHVNENAESLRHKFVSHKGKRELVVEVESFPADETWPDAIALWSASVREYIDPQLHAALVCNFSTTNPTIRTASEVALLDAFQRYFDYVMMCVCGIPEITLQGTADDWRKIRSRIDLLEPYDLEWWVPRLRPILDEFVKTAEGRPDTNFWKAIYKPEEAYGEDIATGWITDLFPYCGNESKRYKNHTLQSPRKGWALNETGVSLGRFPSGISCAPFTLRPGERCLNLMAGFLGVTQAPEMMGLSPLIGWSVVEPDSIDVFWDVCATRFSFTKLPTDTEPEPNSVGELMAFTSRFLEMTFFADSSTSWKIAPKGYCTHGDLFAFGPSALALAVSFEDRQDSSNWKQKVSLGKLILKDAITDQYVKHELTDVRPMEGTVLEVLERLIAAEGDVSKL